MHTLRFAQPPCTLIITTHDRREQRQSVYWSLSVELEAFTRILFAPTYGMYTHTQTRSRLRCTDSRPKRQFYVITVKRYFVPMYLCIDLCMLNQNASAMKNGMMTK